MIEVIWNSLLELRRLLSSCDQKNFSVQVYYSENNFHIQVGIAEEGQIPQIKFHFTNRFPLSELAYCWDENFTVLPQFERPAQIEYQFINTYLEYCFCSLKAHKLKRAFGISHYAQSLDGKIATRAGNSKWISHYDDLVHCHRMRALCDGILIGTNTLKNDKPRLNVRYVRGDNPVKIVLGNSSPSFLSLMQDNEQIIHFTTKPPPNELGVDQIMIPKKSAVPLFVMRQLYKIGIHSVFIEGGSKTISSFLEQKMIDEIQLYLSPTVFGSGLSNFNLKVIQNVDEAIGFSRHEFIPMGNGMLFRGTVNKQE